MSDDVFVDRHLVIPGDEIKLDFSTSGGPGGQHANRSATRVDLTWNVAGSRALDARRKARVMSALRNRIDASGNLRLSSDRHRSQARNRADALGRLAGLVAGALEPVRPRIPTSAGGAAHARRLDAKRRIAAKKRLRQRPDPSD